MRAAASQGEPQVSTCRRQRLRSPGGSDVGAVATVTAGKDVIWPILSGDTEGKTPPPGGGTLATRLPGVHGNHEQTER